MKWIEAQENEIGLTLPGGFNIASLKLSTHPMKAHPTPTPSPQISYVLSIRPPPASNAPASALTRGDKQDSSWGGGSRRAVSEGPTKGRQEILIRASGVCSVCTTGQRQ